MAGISIVLKYIYECIQRAPDSKVSDCLQFKLHQFIDYECDQLKMAIMLRII